jgi:hypothetical protein
VYKKVYGLTIINGSVKGIQSGLELISKQGTQVVKYIENTENYASWSIKEKGEFIFEVDFERGARDYKGIVYTYGYSLGYYTDGNGNIETEGILEEWLKKGSQDLFIRERRESTGKKSPEDKPLEDIVKLKNHEDLEKCTVCTIPHIVRMEGKDPYWSSRYLGLHKIGGMPIEINQNKESVFDDKTIELIKEIAGVLTSLTREDIGKIIMREDKSSDFGKNINDLDELVADAGRMNQTDNEAKDKDGNLIDRKKYPVEKYGEWAFLKEEFQNLFPYYGKKDGYNGDISITELSNSGRFQVFFEDNRREKINKQICPEIATSLSFGTRRVFKMLSQVISNKTPLFSVEGIENGLHPELYSTLVKSLLKVVNEKEYTERTRTERLHEPRMIISSHAPWIVNLMEGLLKNLYIGVEIDGTAVFVKLTDERFKKIQKEIQESDGAYGLGDLIFSRLYSRGVTIREKYRKEWLGI